MSTKTKFEPIMRQSLVTAGVGLSMMEHGLVFGQMVICLPQLRQEPDMKMDIDKESWIVSICGLSYMPGALVCQFIMGKYGRRKANLISAILVIIGWISMITAPSANVVLLSRVIQGMALGFSNLTSPILVGEYTTPKYRGAFSSTLMLALLFGDFVVHIVGSLLPWRQTAGFCLCVAVLDAIIILKSPETPVFLATQGKYEECRRVFHWLRGYDEEEELIDMIKAAVIANVERSEVEQKNKGCIKKLKMKTVYLIKPLIKSKFYKPVLLMMHVVTIQIWCGHVLMDAYGADVFHSIVGEDTNVSAYIIAMDVLKLLSLSSAIYILTKIQRRLMLKLLIGLNILAYTLLAGYLYAKSKNIVHYNPYIGAALIYLLVFAATTGALPLGCTLFGEIFPLECKEISAMITTFAMSIHIGIKLKIVPYMISFLGLDTSFLCYAVLLVYALLVTLKLLPETKDKTLQNIEEQYWTKQPICNN